MEITTVKTSNTPAEAPGIFISYRRADSEGHAGRLCDDLKTHFGDRVRVFFDVEDIPIGVDFTKAIAEAVGSCAALIAVIGRQWLTVADEKTGKRRIDKDGDHVRIEVATALARDVRVIPALVQGASMPGEDDLPGDLKSLALRNAKEISSTRWEYDVQQLIKALEKILPPEETPPGPTPTPPWRKIAFIAVPAVLLVALGIWALSRNWGVAGTTNDNVARANAGANANTIASANISANLNPNINRSAGNISGTNANLGPAGNSNISTNSNSTNTNPDPGRAADGEAALINTLLPEAGKGYHAYNRERGGANQYGLASTIQAIQAIGAAWHEKHPDIAIYVGDISRKGGGPLPPYKSRRTGREVTIRPFRKNGEVGATNVRAPDYDQALTRELVELIKSKYPNARVLFSDPLLVNSGLTFSYPGNTGHLSVHFPAP